MARCKLYLKALYRDNIVGYGERHHIIPKCIWAVVAVLIPISILLTFREHFLVHWLLTKFIHESYQRKLAYALLRMGQNTRHKKRHVTSWQYAVSRAATVGVKHPKSPEYRAKISRTLMGRKLPPFSVKHRARMGHSATIANNPARVRTLEWNKRNSDGQKRYIAEHGYRDMNKLPKCLCHPCGVWFARGMYTRWHGSKCTDGKGQGVVLGAMGFAA